VTDKSELQNHWRWARRWHPQAQAALDWACSQFPLEIQARGLARYYYVFLWILDEILRTLPDGVNGLKVADVGCGEGVIPLALRHLGAEVWLLDRFDEYAPDKNNHMGTTVEILDRFQRHGMTVEQRDFMADGLPPDWPTFDMITFLAVIEHLPHSPREALMSMRNQLRPGGRIVVATPNHAWIRTRLRLMFGRTVHYPLAVWWKTPFFGHVREYTRAELAQMLRWAGFEQVRTVVSNWAHVTSRLPRARPEEPERWTTRLTLRTPQAWLVAASLMLTVPFDSLKYSLLAMAQKPEVE